MQVWTNKSFENNLLNFKIYRIYRFDKNKIIQLLKFIIISIDTPPSPQISLIFIASFKN